MASPSAYKLCLWLGSQRWFVRSGHLWLTGKSLQWAKPLTVAVPRPSLVWINPIAHVYGINRISRLVDCLTWVGINTCEGLALCNLYLCSFFSLHVDWQVETGWLALLLCHFPPLHQWFFVQKLGLFLNLLKREHWVSLQCIWCLSQPKQVLGY